ncbi:vitamin K epoxide reductase family protein [Sodalinema gerasimenkoae]|uniref:vitamin K epoxide reductase family protein n=1 Tax=Sodalinema gerasimenkoae TaxID=2862348 RepID=UPI0018657F22|nr:vitamin K epoxide reductase family protein [Sodalinema gerasimenkoae]
MTRRSASPRFAPWSRPLMGAIAALGVLETTFLTLVKLTDNVEAICPTQGCNQVLGSAYGTVFGLPLTLFGAIGYGVMLLLALAPYGIRRDRDRKAHDRLDRLSGWGLLAGGSVMAAFSGYLMTILLGELHEFCPYCLLSALLSLSLFGLAAFSQNWEDEGQPVFTSLIVMVVTLVGVTGLYANVKPTVAATPAQMAEGGQKAPPVTTESGAAELALAEYLRESGARGFGAYWCPHCYSQKQLFGAEAFEKLTYIECDANGYQAQPQVCQAAGVRAYPSWEINGELYEGTRELRELARLSGYEGDLNFRHSIRSVR